MDHQLGDEPQPYTVRRGTCSVQDVRTHAQSVVEEAVRCADCEEGHVHHGCSVELVHDFMGRTTGRGVTVSTCSIFVLAKRARTRGELHHVATTKSQGGV